MTKPNPLSYQWFTQALELSSEEEIFIPVSSRAEQKILAKDIKTVAREYSVVDKVQASRIDAAASVKEGKLWVRIFVKATSPLVGFKKGSDGKMERIVLQNQVERVRQVKLMLDDNVPKFEIVKKMKLSPLEQETLLDISNLNRDED